MRPECIREDCVDPVWSRGYCNRHYTQAYRAGEIDVKRQARPRRYAQPKYPTTPEERRARQLRHRYGITVDDYESMLEAQAGRCAICDREATDIVGRRLSVDHDHSDGRVRGLLCTGCNMLIGGLEKKGLGKVMRYLAAT